jgi:phosphatidylglycerol---prolipoprotein diacylglyceryl transferase
MLLHTVFEIAASTAGVLLYTFLRRRQGDPVDDRARLHVLVGAAIGATIGARVLVWIGSPELSLASFFAGKTIVGGLLGGLLGVELTKKLTGITTRTGDLFVYPLITAMIIGRIGCFLSGPADQTHGLPTNLPWAIAIGDGVPRHPVALYEIAFLLLVAMLVRDYRQPGDRFAMFMLAYLLFRFAVDFLKPFPAPVFGVTAIQWASLAGASYYLHYFAGRPRLVAEPS